MRPRIGNPVYEARFVGCGFTLEQAARWLGIHPRTLYRQEIGESRLSGPILRALTLRAGYLGAIHPDWLGWRLFEDGRLYHPGLREGYRPGEVMALPLLYQELAAWRCQDRAQHGRESRNAPENDRLASRK